MLTRGTSGKRTHEDRLEEKFERIKDEIFATVKFVCEIISTKKDKSNNIIEGNPDKIKIVTDHWKFKKSTLSQSPSWYLAEIISK